MTNCRPKILVLDDDPLALELYARELSSDYEVVTSSDVRTCLQHLNTFQPDVLIAEPATENQTGWELLTAMQGLKNPPNLILCSTQDDRPSQPFPPIDRYLIKPVLPVTLHALVDQIVAKRFHQLHQRLDQD